MRRANRNRGWPRQMAQFRHNVKNSCIVAMAACFLLACASDEPPASTLYPNLGKAVDDPKFSHWYRSASEKARTAFFISFCLGKGFRRGSVRFNVFVGNALNSVNIRIQGRL